MGVVVADFVLVGGEEGATTVTEDPDTGSSVAEDSHGFIGKVVVDPAATVVLPFGDTPRFARLCVKGPIPAESERPGRMACVVISDTGARLPSRTVR